MEFANIPHPANALGHFKDFMKDTGVYYDFKDVDLECYNKYKNWLMTQDISKIKFKESERDYKKAHPVPEGSSVTLRATATQNYTFLRWSDGSTANPRTLVANRDYDIVAEFRHKTETRQISVDSYYGETTSSGTYHLGELVEISVIPNEGFHMVHWDDDEDETALVRRFYIDRYTPRFFEAILESDATYHIRVVCEPEVAGTVTGCVEAAHYDEHVEIDVQPAAGWRIVGWSDDGHFDGDHREFEVCEDLELSVYLEEVELDES